MNVVRNEPIKRRQTMTSATDRMLRAVSRANDHLATLGLGETHCVVYTDRHARLLDARGKELIVEPGEPYVACALVVIKLELTLKAFLSAALDDDGA